METNDEMDKTRDEMRTLMSGYLDDELAPDERTRFERYLEEHPDFKRELEEMEKLVGAVSEMRPESLPDEIWDTFLDDVYNRLERRTGWTIFIVGIALLAGFGAYWFALAPWASPGVKVLAALPLGGLLLLFGSVLRERLYISKTDRYSRDVKR